MSRYQEELDRITVNYCVSCERFDCEKNELKKVRCDCPFQEAIDTLQELIDKEKSLEVGEYFKEKLKSSYNDSNYRRGDNIVLDNLVNYFGDKFIKEWLK